MSIICSAKSTRIPKATLTGSISKCSIGLPRLRQLSTLWTWLEICILSTARVWIFGRGKRAQMAATRQNGTAPKTTKSMSSVSKRITLYVADQIRRSTPAVDTTTLSNLLVSFQKSQYSKQARQLDQVLRKRSLKSVPTAKPLLAMCSVSPTPFHTHTQIWWLISKIVKSSYSQTEAWLSTNYNRRQEPLK